MNESSAASSSARSRPRRAARSPPYWSRGREGRHPVRHVRSSDDARVKEFAAKLVVHYGLPAEVAAKMEKVPRDRPGADEPRARPRARRRPRRDRAHRALHGASGVGPWRNAFAPRAVGHSAGGDMWGDRAGASSWSRSASSVASSRRQRSRSRTSTSPAVSPRADPDRANARPGARASRT